MSDVLTMSQPPTWRDSSSLESDDGELVSSIRFNSGNMRQLRHTTTSITMVVTAHASISFAFKRNLSNDSTGKSCPIKKFYLCISADCSNNSPVPAVVILQTLTFRKTSELLQILM